MMGKPVKSVRALAVCFSLALAGPVSASDLPDFERLDEASHGAIRETCASWVMEEGGARIADWAASILPLCEAARAYDIKARAAANSRAEEPSSTGTGSAVPAADDALSRMKSLKAMLDGGLISQADYDAAKAALLQKLTE